MSDLLKKKSGDGTGSPKTDSETYTDAYNNGYFTNAKIALEKHVRSFIAEHLDKVVDERAHQDSFNSTESKNFKEHLQVLSRRWTIDYLYHRKGQSGERVSNFITDKMFNGTGSYPLLRK